MRGNEPTVGSLFSGIGGLDLGLERAGWEVKWQVENNPWCTRVLAKHWPNVPKYGDVRELSGADLEPVDLIAGGFPCQPFSHAGRREGKADNRYLWPDMLRVIREVKPPLVLAENVYGLVTGQQGLLLETVYLDLEAAGYEVAPPIVFPAAALDAPHRRDRVWICAYARQYDRSTQQEQQQEAGAEGVNRLRPESREVVAHTLSKRHDGGLSTGAPQEAWGPTPEGQSHWATEPNVGRVAHGVPSRVDRLRGLGNGAVPQVAEWIGKRLIEAWRQ